MAYGLIETRPGGDVLVIDHNVKEEIAFKYYLGRSRKKKFKLIVDRHSPYHQWIQFIDASQTDFEIYYSSVSAVSTNKIPIGDNSIQRLRLSIEQAHSSAHVYLRPISPSEIEYVVADQNGIESQAYLSDIQTVAI
ncbi:MAG: hypothetical protein Q9O24_03855 [Gammaproteobacteria bacterium]|nr:hypothetical protein [Gammaproteobacteria bacterium]